MASQGEAPIGIVGSGRVAQAFGRLLVERGCAVMALAGRDPRRAEQAAAFVGVPRLSLEELARRAPRLLIAVADDALAEVAARLAGAGASGGVALHTSGAHGPEALEALAKRGVSCGALHPIQTFATPERGVAVLPGALFGITAEGRAAAWAREIVARLDGAAVFIPAACRPLYHAAAVLAGNGVPALVDAAVELMGAAGMEPQIALRALAPLVRASAENALTLGPVAALTGPVERGDLRTIEAHCRVLEGAEASLQRLYRAVSLRGLSLALRRGLPQATARRLKELLEQE